ncbi:M16 family metallopeptidase [Sphingorhabdus sp. SMR4y]|uniref:M16 family metallopeptidase n=1 Tax=Sphingorhabdus sp. SMR4y TaxID=2584094 RepID=UPI000B5CD81D|nr:M16 family metallopeptidase [Sphingorhabdus sp. SMR4y]ASK87480.1 putative zinc protease [Sphingorhabdus sp. SMR4y]
MKTISPRLAPRLASRLPMLLLLFAMLAMPGLALAEDAKSDDALPWLYQNSDVPVDKSWTFGVLDNGLRYAVKHNGVPPGQVSIRLRLDVGSLMERDEEQGFAHFMEHLTFRGSTHVPDGEAKRVWQRLGATFGSDSNAETTPTQTVYKLDLPNANRGSLDESLKILSGMVRSPGLSVTAVNAERPVVLAELRERAGPQSDVQNATRELFFAGQRLATRAPIGTPETLGAATPKMLQLFHQRWYRPEMAVIVIAGDGDPALFEELLNKHFSQWQGKGEPGTIPDFGAVTDDAEISRVVIEPTLPRFISMVIARPWEQVEDTIEYNQQILIDLLALQLINRRLEARARAGGSYLQASVGQDDVSRSIDGTFINIIPLGDDWEAALEDVRGVIADATTTPPSQQDIAREIAEFDAALAIGVESYQTEAARKQADDIVNAVDIRETVATPQVALDVFRAMRGMFTPGRLLDSTQKLFSGVATRALLTSPDGVDDGEVRLAKALRRSVEAASDVRVAQSDIGFESLQKIGKKGSILSSEINERFEIEKLELDNGVRVLMFPNNAERNKIMVNVRFGKGYSGLSSQQETLAWSGAMALMASGIGDLGQEELDKVTTGRRIGLAFGIDNDAFEISADTRPSDLEDQLHLIAAKLAFPRWDPAPVIRSKAAALISYDSFAGSPQAVLGRDLEWLVRGKDPRWKTPDKDDFNQLTAENFRKFWQPILASGPVEVMLFGDFDRDQAVESVLKTFGALPRREPQAIAADARSPQFPSPKAGPEILVHKGDQERAAAMVAWPTGGGLDNVRESRKLEVLSSIFNDRLFEILRSQQGASYSPQVINSWPVEFESGGYIGAQSQLTPDNIDRFYNVVNLIAKDLRENPVSTDELQRVVEPLRQLIARASSGNSFWMSQLEGASYNPRKFIALQTLLRDYTVITPAEVQALAVRYLDDATKWKLAVLPESERLAANDNESRTESSEAAARN